MDALFRSHGYTTQTNAVLVGRSGARYEIDVVASRREDLLDARIGVECKNWSQPIDTAVVARARLARDDLGLGQMVIACPGGATPAARRAAADLGISVWDGPELQTRLGPTTLDALRPAPRTATLRGVARALDGEHARRLLERGVRGRLGLARPAVRWTGEAWLTVHQVRYGCGERAGLRRHLRVRPHFGAYESLGGAALWAGAQPLAVETLADDGAPVLPAAVTRQALAAELARIIARADDLVQPAARDRHAALCTARMIPAGDHVTVDEVTSLAWPVAVAVVDDRHGSRVVAVDAVRGRLDPALGEHCTARLRLLTDHLGLPAGAGTP